MVPGSLRMKFYNLIGTRLLVLTVIGIQMSKNALKSIDIDLIFRPFSGLLHQYLAKYPAQSNLDNEEKIW